jgi:hypothetical protein
MLLATTKVNEELEKLNIINEQKLRVLLLGTYKFYNNKS